LGLFPPVGVVLTVVVVLALFPDPFDGVDVARFTGGAVGHIWLSPVTNC
jgi:hypothetical protein